MKLRKWLCLTLPLTLALVSTEVHATPQQKSPTVDEVVYPTGVFPDDLANVQAAVDAGGTILLKATDADGVPTAFDFGTSDDFVGVELTNDVAILGETVDGQMTTIQGGFAPFRGFDSPVTSAIRGISFHEPYVWAVALVYSNGFEMSKCRILGAFGDPGAAGILIIGSIGSITGTILIADNVMRGFQAQFGLGLDLQDYDAEATIVGNEISDVNHTGIFLNANSRPALISDNMIVPGPELPPFGFGNGIYLGPPSTIGGTYYVGNNVVVCENPNADGIAVEGYPVEFDAYPVVNAIIEKNDVTMYDSFWGAISLYHVVSDSTVRNNKLRGTGAYAMNLSDAFSLGVPVVNNRIHGNNLSHFEATIPSAITGLSADVFLDVHTQNTHVSGHVRTLIDLGVDNKVSGSQ